MLEQTHLDEPKRIFTKTKSVKEIKERCMKCINPFILYFKKLINVINVYINHITPIQNIL